MIITVEQNLCVAVYIIKLNFMKKNVGKTDGVIRLILVAILAISYFALGLSGVTGIVVLGIAVLLCLTVVTGICPLYYPFGINTAEKKKK